MRTENLWAPSTKSLWKEPGRRLLGLPPTWHSLDPQGWGHGVGSPTPHTTKGLSAHPPPGALAAPRLIKPQRDGINAAALPDHVVILQGTSLILAHGLCPGTPSLPTSTQPVLPPLSAPNSCAVMHCFPSSNKLHQKKETALLFYFLIIIFFPFFWHGGPLGRRSVPRAHILVMPLWARE